LSLNRWADAPRASCNPLPQYNPRPVETAFGARYLLKAAAFFSTIVVIALSRVRGYHPFDRFGAANRVTTLRALLVALLAALIGEPHALTVPLIAIVLGTAVTVLDGVDGWLARRSQMASRFGARFDMEVDALLILALAILAWQYGKAGGWVLASGLTRYVFVGAGRIWPWLRRPLSGSLRGKTICIVQIAGLLLALLPFVEPPASAAIAGGSLAALWFSFYIDIRTLWKGRLDR
jgi:phosphatidylglycerophosphate synthase